MRYGVAIGSNLGDRLAFLRRAREALLRLHVGDAPPLISAIYETEPVDCAAEDGAFLNAVMEIESEFSPEQFLATLQQIERELGREPAALRSKNAPRTVDLDLLYADAISQQTDTLTLPHPRLHVRRFVLAPLVEIRPNLRLPGFGQSVTEQLAALPARPAATLFSQTWNA